jgi:hypothetical protein
MNDINVPSAERKMRKWFNLPRFPSPLFKSSLQHLLFCVIYSAVFAAGYRVVVGALPPTGYSSFWTLSASILLAAWPWALLASSFMHAATFRGPSV